MHILAMKACFTFIHAPPCVLRACADTVWLHACVQVGSGSFACVWATCQSLQKKTVRSTGANSWHDTRAAQDQDQDMQYDEDLIYDCPLHLRAASANVLPPGRCAPAQVYHTAQAGIFAWHIKECQYPDPRSHHGCSSHMPMSFSVSQPVDVFQSVLKVWVSLNSMWTNQLSCGGVSLDLPHVCFTWLAHMLLCLFVLSLLCLCLSWFSCLGQQHHDRA